MYYNGTAEIYNAWMNGMYELLFWYALIALAYLLIIGLIWGIVVQKVVENRGYNENWFIWGFFFHIFALIVALTKPNRNVYPPLYFQPIGWKCHCGLINSPYTKTCVCGRRYENVVNQGQQEQSKSLAQSWCFYRKENVRFLSSQTSSFLIRFRYPSFGAARSR